MRQQIERRAARGRTCGRGVTLVEAVLAVVVLALAVPPVLSMSVEANAARVNAALTTRASVLAQAVLEEVLADVVSDNASLGFDALADAGYADTVLPARLNASDAPGAIAASSGLAWTLEVGDLVSATGEADSDAALNAYRLVTVRVSYRSAGGASIVMPVSAYMGDL